MFIYCFILTVLFFSTLVSADRDLCRWRGTQFLIAFLNAMLLSVFIGLRDGIGGDWESYAALVQTFHWPFPLITFAAHPLEPGYVLLDILSNFVNGDIYLVNFVCAIIILGCLLKYSSLLSVNPNFVFFLAAPYILFVVGMNYSRQSVAIALSFLALAYLATGKTRTFYYVAFLALCFHFTAVILIVFMQFKRRLHAALALAIAGLSCSFILFRYPRYLEGNEYLDSKGVWLRMAILLFGVALFFLQRKHWKEHPDAYRVLMRSSLTVLCLLVMSIKFSTIADRLGLYFMFLYVTTAGKILRYSPRPAKALGLAIVTTATYGVFFIWFGLSSAATLWMPYKNLLSRYF
jgi:hypothetical protein